MSGLNWRYPDLPCGCTPDDIERAAGSRGDFTVPCPVCNTDDPNCPRCSGHDIHIDDLTDDEYDAWYDQQAASRSEPDDFDA